MFGVNNVNFQQALLNFAGGGNYCEASVLETESIGMLIGIGKPAGYRFEVVIESGGHSRISAAAGLFVSGRCDQECWQ